MRTQQTTLPLGITAEDSRHIRSTFEILRSELIKPDPEGARPNADTWLKHARAVLREIPFARYYAADDDALRALGAVLCVWQKIRAQEEGKGFTRKEGAEFLKQLVPHIAGAMQSWRPPPE